MRWTVVALPAAWDEIRALPDDLGARLLRMMEMVETHGSEVLRAPHARQVEGKIWELRAKSGSGIARGLYVTVTGQQVVILHVFQKKTQKTPGRALALARERLKGLGG